jgi:hypothetical protein
LNYPLIICVIAYNRPNKLKNLLDQLSKISHINENNILIYISVDGPKNFNIKNIIDNYINVFINLKIVYHEKNIGLKNHIILAGNQCAEFGDFIMLEDDILISNYIIEYSLETLKIYQNSQKIRQISLYSIDWNEFNNSPFFPISGGDPVYLAKTASSWGQIWTSLWWKEFSIWFQINKNNSFADLDLPNKVKLWSDSSWKKYFNYFLVANDYYVIYPRDSYTKHDGNYGTHMKGRVSSGYLSITNVFSKHALFPDFNSFIHYYDQYLNLYFFDSNKNENKIIYSDVNFLKIYSTKQIFFELLSRLKSKYLKAF